MMKYFTDIKMFMSNECHNNHDIDDYVLLPIKLSLISIVMTL